MKSKKKLKMIYIYMGIIIILFGGIYAIGNLEKDNKLYGMPSSKLNPATKQLLNNPNYQNIILPEELDQKVADKEDFFVYMFAADCRHCMNTTPQLVPLAQELNIDLPMFNLLEFRSYFTKYGIEFTPTLAYFKDGVEVDRIVGGISESGSAQGYTVDDYRNFFVKYSEAEAQ